MRAVTLHQWESVMTIRTTHEQITAQDDKGERHAVMVKRLPVPGTAHLHSPPHYSWNEGQKLHLVDAKAGILECELTGQRLKIENWHG
jgi:hypothetical protein